MDDAGERVLQIFEASRQTPGTPYEPERLLAFLTEPPADRGRMVRDTFSGRRRFVKFMEALQLELGICFTKEEWDRGYSLSQLTEGIQGKLGAFPGQVRLAESRVREARMALTDQPVKFGILGGALLGLAGTLTRRPIGYVVAGVLWVGLVGVVFALQVQELWYAKRLLERVGGRRTRG